MSSENKNIIKGRRDFLRNLGYGVGAISIGAACRRTSEKLIPHFIQPENYVPGESYTLYTTYYKDHSVAGIEVKMIDGRPVLINGNTSCPISKGAVTHNIQSSILPLYNHERNKYNQIANYTDITDIASIGEKLTNLTREQKKILLLTPPVNGPSTQKVLSTFVTKFNATHVIINHSYNNYLEQRVYSDALNISCEPILQFGECNMILSINEDFLNHTSWKTKYIRDYTEQKKKNKLLHYQFEPSLSMTGINADTHFYIKPSDSVLILQSIFNAITNDREIVPGNEIYPIKTLVKKLLENKGKSVVVANSDQKEVHQFVFLINQALGNINNTILIRELDGTKRPENDLASEIVSKPDAILMWKCNPVYHHADLPWDNILNETELSVCIDTIPHESANLTKYFIPSRTYLEEWNDFYPVQNWSPLSSPVINNYSDRLQAEDILLKICNEKTGFDSLVKQQFSSNLSNSDISNLEKLWEKALKKGGYNSPNKINTIHSTNNIGFNQPTVKNQAEHSYEIFISSDSKTISPDDTLNPWIMELPDPVNRIAWDQYATIGKNIANEYQLKNGDVVQINNKIKIAVLISDECHPDVVSIPANYGRSFKNLNSNLCIGINTNKIKSSGKLVKLTQIEKTGETTELCVIQHHMNDEYQVLKSNSIAQDTRIYPKREYNIHHWHMIIDLEKCIGCGSCVIACQAENNIPVVGRKESLKGHQMHWLKVDRIKNGNTNYLPLMCQHCDNAPCENVCPVNATTHSSEGINQMVYNRCIGARYCSSNCPYKIRKFNWKDYTGTDAITDNKYDPLNMTEKTERLMLNPDVTVRAKGVNEKCSFCIQRIQKSKLDAKLANKTMENMMPQTACQQVCPANAILFGDRNNPDFALKTVHYQGISLLSDLNTEPSVTYLLK